MTATDTTIHPGVLAIGKLMGQQMERIAELDDMEDKRRHHFLELNRLRNSIEFLRETLRLYWLLEASKTDGTHGTHGKEEQCRSI